MKRIKRRFFLFLFFILLGLILFFNFRSWPFFNNKLVYSQLSQKNSNQTQGAHNKKEGYQFSFIITGDNHGKIKIYQKLFNKINKEDYAFIVDLGDCVNWGKEKEYKKVKENFEKANIPVYHVVGNHDIYGRGGEFWSEYFGQKYYSWDYQNAHFVVLDNVLDINNYWSTQLDWLEKDLSSSQKKFKFIFVHAPLLYPQSLKEKTGFDIYKGFRGPISKKKLQRFFDIVKKYRVNNIYAGHTHIFSEYSIDDISITTIPSLGGKIYSTYDLLARYFDLRYEYLKIDIYNNYFRQELVGL